MKIVLLAVVAFAALQACAADGVRVSATASGLTKDELAIVNGFLELIQGVVQAGGDINQMQGVLSDIKTRVEKKLHDHGPEYLHTLARTLSQVNITNESLQAILDSINSMAAKDGVAIKSRGKRSPSPKKKKKGKKGKKGCGK